MYYTGLDFFGEVVLMLSEAYKAKYGTSNMGIMKHVINFLHNLKLTMTQFLYSIFYADIY